MGAYATHALVRHPRSRWTDGESRPDALEGLDYKVYDGNPFLSDMARAYHEQYGRDVLGLLRDGVLNVERFLGELDDELKDDVDDRVFGLRLQSSMQFPQEDRTAGCGIRALLRRGRVPLPLLRQGVPPLARQVSIKSQRPNLRAPQLEPVVDMESVRVAQARAGERWTGCVYFDRDPPVAPPKLWTVLPARRRPLRQGMGGGALAARAHRMLTETAARRAALRTGPRRRKPSSAISSRRGVRRSPCSRERSICTRRRIASRGRSFCM